MINLTGLETAFISFLANDDFMREGDETWSQDLCSGTWANSGPGVMSSLVKKDVIWTAGAGSEATVGFTELGETIAQQIEDAS